MTAALVVRGVGVTYGEVRALDRVSVDIAEGTVCGLVGVNGSGKSTLMKAIMGLISPEAGEIRIAASSIAAAREAGSVGYVAQHEEHDRDFPVSVRDVVMMGRYHHMGMRRRPSARDNEIVNEALARVGLSDLGKRAVGRLSGGQRKRAFIARAIAQRARILLLDEPFAGVDAASERLVASVLRGLAREGATVVVSTHGLHALPELVDDVIILDREVVAHGAPADVLTPERVARAFGLEAGEMHAGAAAHPAPAYPTSTAEGGIHAAV